MKWFKLCLVLLVLASGCANVEKATQSWDAWLAANRPGVEVVARACDSSDSDGNGRVRCNATLKQNGDFTTISMECPSGFLPQFADTCQEPAIRK